MNVAPLNYSIKATLYNQNGKVNEATIPIANGQQQNYENFLQEVFAYQGAGTVELDAWFGVLGGSSDNEFLLNVEVYTESPSGRYKTIVIPAGRWIISLRASRRSAPGFTWTPIQEQISVASTTDLERT